MHRPRVLFPLSVSIFLACAPASQPGAAECIEGCGPNQDCVDGRCECAEGFDLCGSDPLDGCNVDLRSDPSNCGACGVDCSAPNAVGTCERGACVFQCVPGFSSCAGDEASGCETASAECPADCVPEDDPSFCDRLGAECGLVSARDNCGDARSAACGDCSAPLSCGAVEENVCGCAAETDADFCERLGKDCGTVTGEDDCGVARSAACGDCTAPLSCGAVEENVCGWVPFERGRVISSELLSWWSAEDIRTLSAAYGRLVPAEYDVSVYKVVYETIDPWGAPTQASGAVALPDDAFDAIPLVSYQHGTVLLKTNVPSNESGEELLGVVFASIGYVAVLSDYLGLGESPGFHPYHHAVSQATVCIDMLRAGKALAGDYSVALDGQLFLIGYSQGGHATLSLQRELEAAHGDEFPVTASAPMAGAYDLSGVTTDDFLSGRPMPNPYYFAYLLEAYRRVYGLADSLADILVPPYDVDLPPLLDGYHSTGQVNSVMPAAPMQILDPDFLDAFLNDVDDPLRVALRENDLLDWTPQAPVRLYHCSGDQDVLFANSEVALASLRQRGASDVELVDPAPGADHGGCVLPAFLEAMEWFDSFRAPEP